MCFHSKQTKTAVQLENRFNAKFENAALYSPNIYNGFQHPKTPVITNAAEHTIQMYNWGLIPFWAKDDSIRKNTLNARFETLKEKPSFRSSLNNRCLVLADGFYEWQWLDEKGKKKQKYLITRPHEEAFAFAGLWNDWVDKSTGKILETYTIITIKANELMAKIHNTKKRMPFILSHEIEEAWLQGEELKFQDIELVAKEI